MKQIKTDAEPFLPEPTCLLDDSENLQKSETKIAKAPPRLTQLSHGGGCGCKIDPGSLHDILAKVPRHADCANLLVGIEHSDDAAIYKLNDQQALVVSNDFFTATVDDPYTFGRIAAANALSDIYAMGGEPIMANAIVGFPVNTLSMESMQEIMHGGVDVCTEAGVPLAGGHSIDNPQPIFGLAAMGLVHPEKFITNSGAQEGDVLLMTKPLGIGILASAYKLDMLNDVSYQRFVETITKLNQPGAWLGKQDGVHALTDVTGFGLAGHLVEMAEGSHLQMVINTSDVPVLEEAWSFVMEGVVPGGAYRNMHSYGDLLRFDEEWDIDRQLVFSDPQTNGGLLAAVSPQYANEYCEALKGMGYQHVEIIGEVTKRGPRDPAVLFKQ